MMDKKQLPQGEKFRQAARDLNCEESEEVFDAKLGAIAKQMPKDMLAQKGSRKPASSKKQ